MIAVSRLPPSEALSGFVRYFQGRHGCTRQAPIRYPVATRPETFVEFYLRDRHEIVKPGGDRRQRSSSIVLVGPQCPPDGDLVLDGEFDVFTIHFQPAGLGRLFDVPLREYTSRSEDAASLLGSAWHALRGELQTMPDLHSRKIIAERFLSRHLDRAAPAHPIHALAIAMLDQREPCDVATLARRSHLSIRQFERRFEHAIGVSPKLFGRIVRFSRTLRRKSLDPARTWTHLAHEAGYHDLPHLARDFKLLAGGSPSEFSSRRSAVHQWSPLVRADVPARFPMSHIY